MMVSAATYTGAGAVFSYKLARRFSSVPAALLAVLSIFACTNLFYYATQEPLMSHVYSYFLISLFCWCGLRIIDGPRPWHVFTFLFSGALLVLIRQLNVVVFLFPLWMAWTSPSGLRGSWEHLLIHKKALLIGVVAGVIPWLLQMLYWHHLTGSFYVNPYAFVGEHFEWDRMVPGLVLFSPRNGWFVYSPIFLVVVAALLVQAWRNKRYARPLLFILLFTVLIYSAWWCWWLGGGFGYRGLVDLYGLLAIPFAVFFRSLLRRSWSLRIFAAVLICVLIRLNFGMIEHRDFDIYNVNTEWPPLLEVVGEIAAGN